MSAIAWTRHPNAFRLVKRTFLSGSGSVVAPPGAVGCRARAIGAGGGGANYGGGGGGGGGGAVGETFIAVVAGDVVNYSVGEVTPIIPININSDGVAGESSTVTGTVSGGALNLVAGAGGGGGNPAGGGGGSISGHTNGWNGEDGADGPSALSAYAGKGSGSGFTDAWFHAPDRFSEASGNPWDISLRGRGGEGNDRTTDYVSLAKTVYGGWVEITFYAVKPPYWRENASYAADGIGTGTLNIPYTANRVAGDFLFCHVVATDATTASITTPAGWTSIDSRGSGTQFSRVFYKISDGTETGNLAVTYTGSAYCIGRMVGLVGGSGVEGVVGAFDNSSSTTVNYQAMTSVSEGALMVTCFSGIGASPTVGQHTGDELAQLHRLAHSDSDSTTAAATLGQRFAEADFVVTMTPVALFSSACTGRVTHQFTVKP